LIAVDDILFISCREMTWVEPKVLGEPPTPRGGHSSTLVGSYLYIFGGSSEEGLLSDLHRLNLENVNKGKSIFIQWFTSDLFIYLSIVVAILQRIWEQLNFEGEKPTARTNHKAVLDNSGRVVIFGGYTVRKQIITETFLNSTFFV